LAAVPVSSAESWSTWAMKAFDMLSPSLDLATGFRRPAELAPAPLEVSVTGVCR
jgi:hypothetical protein